MLIDSAVRTWIVLIIIAISHRVPLLNAQSWETNSVPAPVLEATVPASVCVFPAHGDGGGSGVLIDPSGLALTNYHVVQPCGAYMRCGLADSQVYDAVLIGLDPTGDVALIQLLGRDDFPSVRFADSDRVRAGDTCFALGNPFLLATDFQPSLSVGIVSAVHRYQYPADTLLEYADCIQTDAAINPGNSGGPLFDVSGKLIGINGRCSFEKRGRINVGVGYAISINQIKMFLSALAGGRIVDHATLGATVTSTADGLVVVDQILESSDAYRRGLRYGDQIVEFGGRRIQTVNQFKNTLGIFPADWTTTLVFRRNDLKTTVPVRLPALHSDQELAQRLGGLLVPPDNRSSAERRNQLPEPIKEVFEAKAGFANYHFNRLQRERLLNWGAAHPLAQSDDVWRLVAQDQKGESIQLILDTEKSGLAWGEEREVFDPRETLGDAANLGDRRGLLVAFHCWRQFYHQIHNDRERWEYGGSFPWPGPNDGWHDTLRAQMFGCDCEVFFDTNSHELRGLRLSFDNTSDPWSIDFASQKEGLPNQCTIWRDPTQCTRFEIRAFER